VFTGPVVGSATLAAWLRTSGTDEHDTWTRASRELETLGLLTKGKQPQGRDFDWRRTRNTYWIDKTVLNAPMPKP